MSIEKTIKYASEKDYTKFESSIEDKMTDKMKNKLSSFMNYIEKTYFEPEKKE